MAADQPSPGNEFEDLTARARIRNVALAHFAERGAKGTTIRGVAHDAGVSPSSVQHHFGTKDGLREACDAYVTEYLRRGVTEGVTQQAIADPGFLTATYQSAPPIMRYLARALADGSPTATALFDEIVALTEAYLAVRAPASPEPHDADTRGQAAVFTAMKLGVVVLHEHLSRTLDIDTLTPDGLTRINKAILDIVSPHIIGNELYAAAGTTLDHNQQRDDHPDVP